MNTGRFIFMAGGCEDTDIARAWKYLWVLHSRAMEQAWRWHGEVYFSVLEQILSWKKIV